MKLLKVIKKKWPYVMLIGVWLTFFYKFYFLGLLPLPLDIIVGMYFPWLNQKWGYQVGVPVKNYLISDVVSQVWIWRNWAIDLFRQGRIAIWNPHVFAGYPLSPWFHTVILSPLNLVYFFTDNLTSTGIIITAQSAVGLLSMFLFLRLHLKDSLSAIFGAISFAFSAFFIGWLAWGSISFTISLIPLVLFFVKKLELDFSGWNLIGLFLAYLSGLLAGYPQAFWHLNIVLGIYFFITFKNKYFSGNQKKTIILCLLLALTTALIVILPSLEILNFSIRGLEGHLIDKNYGFISVPKTLILIFAPNFYGNPASQNYWGGGLNYVEYLVWYGTTSFFLSLVGLFSKNIKIKKLSLFIIGVGLILSYQYPLGWLIYKLNVPLISTIPASRNLFLVSFGGIILSALGLKVIINNKLNSSQWRKVFCVWLGIIIGIFLGFSINYYILKNPTSHVNLSYLTPIIKNLKVGYRNSVIPTISSFLFIFGLYVVIKIHKKLVTTFFSFSVLCLLIIESFYFGWKYLPFINRNYYFPETETLEFLISKQQEGDFFRVERQQGELLPPNMWMAYGLSSTAGYDPVYPTSYANWLKNIDVLGDYTRYLEWDRPKTFFDEMGVKYFLVLKRDPQGGVSSQGSLPYWLDQEKWIEVKTEGPVAILENRDYHPPYYLESGDGLVKLAKKENNLWEFVVESEKDGRLIVKENYFPGWKVSVNNLAKEIQIIDGTFKAVNIPSGKSKVVFYYQNRLLRGGMYLSLLSISAFIFVIIKQKQ